MEISVILAHPSQDSLDHALARAIADGLATAGHDVHWHGLAQVRFDPLLTPQEIAEHRSDDATVERHCRELAETHGLVLVHPNWFTPPPALLEGGVDRVVRGTHRPDANPSGSPEHAS